MPLAIRKRFALRYFGKTAAVSAVLFAVLLYLEMPLDSLWLVVFPIGWGGIVAAKYLLTREVVEITEHGKAVAAQEQEGRWRRAQERVDKWYVRYPIAILLLGSASWLVNSQENLWWLSLLLVVYAGIYAGELSLIILVCIGGYLLFQGVAALPISVAIVLGALIIASAKKN